MDDLSKWFENEAATVDSTTLANFETMINDYLGKVAEKEALEKILAEKNNILQQMLAKLRAYFEGQGITSFKTRAGTLILNQRVSYKAPDGDEREQCLEILRERGDIDKVTGFNAQKFSSWYREQLDAEPEFTLPGVKREELVYMSFKRNK